MTTVLLTGANGQVGWEVSRQAPIAGICCRTLGRSELDISSRSAVLSAIAEVRPRVVVNAAAYTAVDKAESDPNTAFSVNHEGTKILAEACAAAGAVLIHLSTDYVFDGAKRRPYKEEDAVAPLGIYGKSKLAGEEAIRECCPAHVILRTSWVYGVHGHNFVRTILRVANESGILRVVDDQFGTPTFAADIAQAIPRVVRSLHLRPSLQENFGTFHCSAQGVTTWCRFAREIFARTGRNVIVHPIDTKDYPTPARRPDYSVLDCGKLARVYRVALRPWEVALGDMLRQLQHDCGQQKNGQSIASGAGR